MSKTSHARRLFYGPYQNAGVLMRGVTEVQTLIVTGSPTGGTFRLRLGAGGVRTSAIVYNAAASAVQAALEALPAIGSGGVVCTGGPLGSGAVTVTFAGKNAAKNVETLTLAANALTGGASPTVAIVVTTAGIDTTARGALSGALLIDTASKRLYQNEGSESDPQWRMRGGNGPVEAHTADDTLVAEESGSWHTNTGAAGTVTLVLPPASVGLEFSFAVGAAQSLRIDPNGSQTISLPSTGVPGAAGKYLACSTVGATVRLFCAVTGNWAVAGHTGTWTAET